MMQSVNSQDLTRKKYIQGYLDNPSKSIALMGMSGVGKTTLSRLLPQSAWFHYSVDYRIGTRYLNEAVNDFLKCEAMKNPLFAQLLRTDSIFIGANLTIDNLAPLSVYLGMVGQLQKGGLTLETFLARLDAHRQAEIAATQDVVYFIEKAKNLYGYPNFLCDTSGSLCEIDHPATWEILAAHCLLIYIKSTPTMQQALIERAQKYPKPLYYQKEFLLRSIATYCQERSLLTSDEIDPAEFAIWVFPHLVSHRLGLYQKIADQYGLTVAATDTALIKNERDFIEFIQDQALRNMKY
jgi:hypothetical protein